MGDTKLTWDNAPESLDAKMLGELLSARPVWIRRNLRDLARTLGPRLLRWQKRDVLEWLEAQQLNGQ